MNKVINQNHKMARDIASEEGTHFIVNENAADNLLQGEVANMYNEKIDEYTDKLDSHANKLEEYAKQFNESIGDMEIKATGSNLLVMPYSQNPFQHIKTTESGLILNTGGLIPETKSNLTGEEEEKEPDVIVGSVIDAGPSCRYIQEGDVVMWANGNHKYIPFFNQNINMISEAAVLCVINSGLTERFNSAK